MKFFAHILLLIVFLPVAANAQLEFVMSDTTVTECKGVLFDAGGEAGEYPHNSNLTFTICLEAPGVLTFSFESFCVEVGFDSLTFHNGPDESYPQIGPAWSGTGNPDPVSISSGCLTLHFVSDANVACTGWSAWWTTEVVPPVAPLIDAILPVPACSSQTLNLSFTKRMHCDSVYVGAFELTGALEQAIVSVNPLNCSGDSTNQVQLTLAEGLNLGGDYEIQFTSHYRDACDSIWTFVSSDQFNVIDCPIVVNLQLQNDTICNGSCTELTALVNGGDGNYSYTWSGLPLTGPGPHTVCPPSTTIITLQVDDTSPAAPASGSVTLFVATPAVLPPVQTICQSEPPFQLSAIPAQGQWTGSGIIDDSGIFSGDSALAGINTLFYMYEAYPQLVCTTSTQINVLPIDAGFPQAACPGSAPFQLVGFSPPGGSWSGPQVSSGGIFDPVAIGVYELSYSVNGCTENLSVYVDNISQTAVIADTLCQSDASDTLQISPPGGRWYGPGIVDSLFGVFDPGETEAGTIHLSYVLNGCSREVQVYVKEIWAGWNRTACPSQEAFQLEDFSPAGGSWTGDGISNEGLFDPAWNGGEAFDSDVIYSHPNGCTDTAKIWVFYTSIGLDTLVFCSGNPGIMLHREELDTDPWEGVWSGPGVLNGSDPDAAEFSVLLAGNGIHTLVFEENTCADSVVFIVQQAFLSDLPASCEAAPAFEIEVPEFASAYGGSFEGPGIVNDPLVFHPGEAGEGLHELIYTSAEGCKDTVLAEVTEFVQAQIDASGALLCFTDTLIPIEIYPENALLTGNGIVDNAYFNPQLAGEGPHLLTLVTGEGFCTSTDTTSVYVAPAIGYSLFVSKDSLCYGEFTSMLVNAYGGNGNLITYTWNQGLAPLQQHIISPSQSTVYRFEISDGCAVIRDSVAITVYPEISFGVQLSEPACYGEEGFAEITGNHGGVYQVIWRNEEYGQNMPLPGQSSVTYMAQVRDTSNGCSVDTSITIPGYPLVQALFAITPNEECVSFDQDSVRFIDLSSGGTMGTWSFGDGSSSEYIKDINPAHDYDTYGDFTVILEISDTNGCSSKLEKTLCILEPYRVYVPTAITLNNDGLNETLEVKGSGIKQLELFIYNRRGDEIWHGKNEHHAWDGKFAGMPVQSGVYAYIIEVEWTNGSLYTQAGTVTVIR